MTWNSALSTLIIVDLYWGLHWMNTHCSVQGLCFIRKSKFWSGLVKVGRKKVLLTQHWFQLREHGRSCHLHSEGASYCCTDELLGLTGGQWYLERHCTENEPPNQKLCKLMTIWTLNSFANSWIPTVTGATLLEKLYSVKLFHRGLIKIRFFFFFPPRNGYVIDRKGVHVSRVKEVKGHFCW